MNELAWARSTMATSLGFHIVFAGISMILPLYMAAAQYRYQKTGDPEYRRLTKAWSHGAAVLFATGAVSGTVLSFQLGLLWPGFMKHAGPIIGMPFSLEGAAFFLEAIFMGFFLYGWDKLSPRRHFAAGLMVGVCGLFSGLLVIAANGWMNSPTGFDWVNGAAEHVDPWAAMFNPAWPREASHMLVAAFQATGTAVAGLHAWGMLRGKAPELHKRALKIVLPITCVASLVQPILGDISAKGVAVRQPEKLAAMEAHFETSRDVGIWLGGIPDEATETVKYGVQIPNGLSFLAHGDFHAEVIGLDRFPKADRPPVLVTHFAFQIMVGIGTLLALGAVFYFAARRFRPAWLEHKRFFQALVLLIPTGFIALEAGWVVTEVGRQPWVIYRILRTSESVTPVPGQVVTFVSITVLYLFLGCMSALVLARIIRAETTQSVSSDGGA